MISLFDYIFYRIYRFYIGQGSKLADSFASSLLALMQFLTLVDIMFIVKIFWDFPIPNKVYFIPAIVIILALNWYRYERTDFYMRNLDDQWKDEESAKKKRNGWLIVLYLLWSFSVPVTYGILKH